MALIMQEQVTVHWDVEPRRLCPAELISPECGDDWWNSHLPGYFGF